MNQKHKKPVEFVFNEKVQKATFEKHNLNKFGGEFQIFNVPS